MKVVVDVEAKEVIKEESFIEYVKNALNSAEDYSCALVRLFADFLCEKNYDPIELFFFTRYEREPIIEEFAVILINGFDEDYFFSAEL